MTRTATGLGIAAALGFAVSLGAQTTSTPQTTTPTASQQTTTARDSHELTVTGCLARNNDGTFTLDTTKAMAPTGTTGSSTVGATAAEPASPASTTTAGAETQKSWKLEGGTDLERHVGHTIEVTGRAEGNEHSTASSSTTTATGTTGSASTTTTTGGARLEVTSVKMVASSCQ